MANILQKTEQLDDAGQWTAVNSLVVTPNICPPPLFAGANARWAYRLDNQNAAGVGGLDGAYQTIANDSSFWVVSVHIKADSFSSRFPWLVLELANGSTPVTVTCALATNGGTIGTASGSGAPFFSGVDSASAPGWFKFWFSAGNNSSGNTALRVRFQPANSGTIGGVSAVATQGYADVWGFNVTNNGTAQPYEPAPDYPFDTRPIMMTTFSA